VSAVGRVAAGVVAGACAHLMLFELNPITAPERSVTSLTRTKTATLSICWARLSATVSSFQFPTQPSFAVRVSARASAE
jgi:hypothetical protein